MKIERLMFHGFDSISLSHNGYSLTIPLEVGIRILSLTKDEDHNWLYVSPEDRGAKGDSWRLFGGHRLWLAPEHETESYEPDNAPIAFSEIENGVELRQQPGSLTGLAKKMRIQFQQDSIVVSHDVANQSSRTVTASLWAITALTRGGIAEIPLPAATGRGLNPSGSVVIWPYTNMNDPRLEWHAGSLRIRQDSLPALKLGTTRRGESCTLTYERGARRFSKTFATPDAQYADMGTVAQCYTSDALLELESLSPLVTLTPGQSAAHSETWRIEETVTAG